MAEEKKEKEGKKKRIKVEIIEEGSEKVKKEDSNVDKDTQKETSSKVDDIEKVDSEKKEPETPKEEKPKEKVELPFWVLFFSFLLGLILGAGLIGGIFYFRTNVDKLSFNDPEETSSEITGETADDTTEAEELTEIDYSIYNVHILNGSGIKGEAAKVETLFINNEFTDTETGNADSYDYEDTEIYVKEDVSDDVKDKIKETLNNYQLTEIETLDEDYDFDIKIVVGSGKSSS